MRSPSRAPWVKGLRPGRLGEFSVDAAADDLLGLLNANGVESMGLVGSGLGAVVALAAAQRAPECVSDLVLEGATVKYGRLALGAQKTPHARVRRGLELLFGIGLGDAEFFGQHQGVQGPADGRGPAFVARLDHRSQRLLGRDV